MASSGPALRGPFISCVEDHRAGHITSGEVSHGKGRIPPSLCWGISPAHGGFQGQDTSSSPPFEPQVLLAGLLSMSSPSLDIQDCLNPVTSTLPGLVELHEVLVNPYFKVTLVHLDGIPSCCSVSSTSFNRGRQ